MRIPSRTPPRGAFLVASLVLLPVAGGSLAGESAPRTVVTILHTSDLHAQLLPWDYSRGVAAPHGIAKVATLVRTIRKERPDALLVDTGDTIQGSPLGYLHARGKGPGGPDPTVTAMSAVGWDAMAVGNHEFNFGMGVLRKAERESSFPWLSANTRNADGSPAFREYVVRTVSGVRVGILGMTTPNIPSWEPEANRPGLRWEDPPETARRLVPLLRTRERCDLVVVAIHSGIEEDLETGKPNGTAAENRVAAIARSVPGIDLILTGHAHRIVPLTRLHGVPVIQPGRWGEVLDRIDVTLERRDGRYEVVDVAGRQLAPDASVPVDPDVARIAAPHDRASRAYLDEVIATAEDDFPAERARLEDSALLDLINDTQRQATGAQLSMTSLLGRYAGFRKGPVRVRDVYSLYPYDNQLLSVEVDGATLKACLENAATYYDAAEWLDGRLQLRPRRGMMPFNFDVVSGASYRVDPTAPVGSRVRDLRLDGRPIRSEDRLSLAVNSYRAQGSGGYVALTRAKVLKVVAGEIRDLLIERLREMKRLVPRVDRNWVLAPDAVWREDAFAPDPGTSEGSVEGVSSR